MSGENKHISIWFFIGSMLVIYGVLITGQGIYELANPAAAGAVVLAELHVSVWWGVLLLAIGALYSWKFFPKR